MTTMPGGTDRRDQLGTNGQVSYQHDRNGSLTGSSAGLQIEYNAAHQTTAIAPPGGREIGLAYAGQSQVERTMKGSIDYANNALGASVETQADSATRYIRDGSGRLVSMRRGSQSFYYLTDAIGSVLAVTNPDATVGARYSYDPFGNAIDTSGSIAQPYRFAGEYQDEETGYYKIGLRYYDPQTARWTQKDPVIGFSDPRRTNRYIYAGQDPINNTDPSGAGFIDDVRDTAVDGLQIASDVGRIGLTRLAAPRAVVPCLAAIATSGPASPLVAFGCGVFAVGSLAVVGQSLYDIGSKTRRIGRRVGG